MKLSSIHQPSNESYQHHSLHFTKQISFLTWCQIKRYILSFMLYSLKRINRGMVTFYRGFP